jgi:DNA-binding NtrC family response regulator
MTREILLIDDDEDELEIFSQALRAIDKTIQCTLAKDLEKAKEYFKNNSPAYVFIDFNMPKENGPVCLAELNKIKHIEKSKIVLYSNYINEEMIEKAMALGAFKCVKKPNMINLLARRLKEILGS